MPDPVFDYQDKGAHIMAPRRRFANLDGMGVGKTATTIRAADYAGAIRFLGVMPASLRVNWSREIQRFGLYPRRTILANTAEDLKAWMMGYYDVCLLSYDRAANFAELFLMQAHMFPLMIIDEAHYLKNPEAARTKKILGPELNGKGGIPMFAKQGWWVTGTPAPNDPADIYTMLRFMDGVMPLQRSGFISRYFKSSATTYGSRQKAKQDKLAELQEIIKSVSFSRSTKDVGIELPPVFLTSVAVDGDTRELETLLREHPEIDERIREAAENQSDLSELDDEYMAALRRLIAEAKAPQYARMIYEELQNGLDKVVIFGHHRTALQSIFMALEKKGKFRTVMLQGGMSDTARQEAIDSFNNDDYTRVFIGNHRAAGVGLNLQKSCCSIDIFEEDWSPAVNAQSIKRIARYGQTKTMRARFVRLAHHLEEAVQTTNIRKTRDILELGLSRFL